jgi:acyl-CoA thioesterase II
VVDSLVALLDLERLEDDLFRGYSPAASPVRVFGGQVAAQALVASGRTVPSDRRVHSLHAYFVRPGDPHTPIVFQVERVRDGGSFSTRRVSAIQHGKPIFTMSSSFQTDELGVEHALPFPDVPAAETLPTLEQRTAATAGNDYVWTRLPRPVDIRYVDLPPWLDPAPAARSDAVQRVWFRPDGVLPADPLLHVCVLAYLSDLSLLDVVLAEHGLVTGRDVKQMASLDHAMWFHRPIDLSGWVLYDTESPSASGGRGLATGHFWSADGVLLATVVQEGLIRAR